MTTKANKTIKSFDRSTCRDVSAAVEEALRPLGERLGLTFRPKGGSFSGTSYTLKLEAVAGSDDGAPTGREAEAFALYATRYGLTPDDLGRTFMVGGQEHRLVGCSPRAYKKPLLTTCNGKSYKWPSETVARYLGAPVGPTSVVNGAKVTIIPLGQCGQRGLTVALASRGNPDFRQDPRRPLPDVRDEVATVSTLREAGTRCREWIEENDLGGGNWTGGQVRRDGVLVAYVGYNGTVWPAGPGHNGMPDFGNAKTPPTPLDAAKLDEQVAS